MKSIQTIQTDINKILERAIAIEELLLSLETIDIQHRKDRWKKQQNSELSDLHLKLQRSLTQSNVAFDAELTQKQTEYTQVRTGMRNEEAKSSLYRTKLTNVLKGIEEKEVKFCSAEFVAAREAREQYYRQKNAKKETENELECENIHNSPSDSALSTLTEKVNESTTSNQKEVEWETLFEKDIKEEKIEGKDEKEERIERKKSGEEEEESVVVGALHVIIETTNEMN
jgi:hypothetical protein